ncbi:GntR family transcriptional regulator [Methylopila sp. M107]|uniref:GntR family transcriptional regulator n=1 Tax=Methylopila sp. M107 TaxID=1101190 RepID=UPI0003A714CD|nr:GntR family transcriptional regulator [Methylopila sp. M107]
MPAYRQIEEQISGLIEDGTLPPGATLPAARQLAKELSISRATVQYSYDALRRRRLVSGHGRLGFIVEPGERIKPAMERLKGFTEEMRELGRASSSRVLEKAVVVDRSIASLFQLPSNAPLLKLVRVRFGDGVPLSRESAWYDLAAAPGLEDRDFSGSVYEQLAACGAPLQSCEQTIEAAEPDAEECEIFGFDAPIPCLLIKRRSFAANARMVEYVEGLFRGDAYAYRLTLSI